MVIHSDYVVSETVFVRKPGIGKKRSGRWPVFVCPNAR
jgi:hypothetical protein